MEIGSATRHAMKRAQQRGISLTQIDAVTTHADSSRHHGNDVKAVWISKRKLARIGRPTLQGTDIDRLRGLVVLVSSDGKSVTVFRNAKARRYRRSR